MQTSPWLPSAEKQAALPWFSTTIIEEPTWLVSGLLSGPREKTEDFLQSKESKAGWGAGLGGERPSSGHHPQQYRQGSRVPLIETLVPSAAQIS